MENKGGFFKSNWAYLIWFCFYFSFTFFIVSCITKNAWLSLLLVFILYSVCIGLALSPVGEVIVRFLEGIKPVQTQEDKDNLLPIFEEVYEEVKAFSPTINQNIELYLTDSITVNAFAVGRKTIAITKGAVYTLSREELKGILAHEFGHMANGDTKALLIKIVGNGFFLLITSILKLVMNLIQFLSVTFKEKNIMIAVFSFLTFICRILFDLSVFAFVFIGDVIISLNSRYSEYLADEYAYSIGYGENLKNALYILNKIALPVKASISERLKATHPYTTARIERLERLQEQFD